MVSSCHQNMTVIEHSERSFSQGVKWQTIEGVILPASSMRELFFSICLSSPGIFDFLFDRVWIWHEFNAQKEEKEIFVYSTSKTGDLMSMYRKMQTKPPLFFLTKERMFSRFPYFFCPSNAGASLFSVSRIPAFRGFTTEICEEGPPYFACTMRVSFADEERQNTVWPEFYPHSYNSSCICFSFFVCFWDTIQKRGYFQL